MDGTAELWAQFLVTPVLSLLPLPWYHEPIFAKMGFESPYILQILSKRTVRHLSHWIRITKWLKSKGHPDIILSNPAQIRVTKSRLSRTRSRWLLSISKVVEYTVSHGKCFWMFRLNPLCLICAHCLLFCHWTSLKRAWLSSLQSPFRYLLLRYCDGIPPEPSSGSIVPALLLWEWVLQWTVYSMSICLLH